MGMIPVKCFILTKVEGLANKICRVVHKSVTFETHAGIKRFNPYFPTVQIQDEKEFYVSPTELFLGVDFLKDNFTLLGVSVIDSPHYRLVDTIKKEEDCEQTEYVQRMLEGKLDERLPIVSYILEKGYFQRNYRKDVYEIEKNEYKPVIVYRIDNRLYIHDGKHHAATAAVLGKNVKCVEAKPKDVLNSIDSSLVNGCMRNSQYSKHQCLLMKMKN